MNTSINIKKNQISDGEHVIYAIFNKQKRRYYIGITMDFFRRKKEHFRHLEQNTHVNKKLQNDYNNSVKDTFEIYVIGRANNRKEAREYEHKQIFVKDSHISGYNVGDIKSNMKKQVSATIDEESHNNLMNHLEVNGITITEWAREAFYEKLVSDGLISDYGRGFSRLTKID